MASTADLEYLRRQRARKQANQAGGTQILQNSGDAIEKTGEDATWTALASGQVQQQPQQEQGQDRNAWQRIWDTERDISNNISRGVFNFFDGILDAGAWFLGLFGNDEWKKQTQDFMNYDWQSQAVAYTNQLSLSNAVMTGDLFNNNYWDRWFALANNERAQANEELTAQQSYQSDWGQVGEYMKQAEQGIGYVIPNAALTAITMGGSTAAQAAAHAASTASLGVSAFGSGTTEALNDGADYYQAAASGLISSGIELGTELASAGIGKGLGKILGKTVSYGTTIGGATIGKQLGKFSLKEIGRAAFEEGMEEVASDLLSPFTKLPYKGGEAFQEYSNPELYEGLLGSFIGGAAGGIFGNVSSGMRARQLYGKRGVAVSQYMEQLNEVHEQAQDEIRKGDKANQKRIGALEEKAGALVKDIATNLDEMASDTSEEGKSQYENLLRMIKNPKDGEVHSSDYFQNHKDIVQQLGETTYDRLARSLSKDGITIKIGTEQQFIEHPSNAFIKNGTEIFVNPAKTELFFPLVGHEAIGHAYLDTDVYERQALAKAIDADEQLSKLFHQNDVKIARAESIVDKGELYELDPEAKWTDDYITKNYGITQEKLDSERMAYFIQGLINNADDLQNFSVFQSNATLRGRIRALLTKVKLWLQEKLGSKSAYAIRKINQALDNIAKTGGYHYTVSDEALAYSKDLDVDYSNLTDDEIEHLLETYTEEELEALMNSADLEDSLDEALDEIEAKRVEKLRKRAEYNALPEEKKRFLAFEKSYNGNYPKLLRVLNLKMSPEAKEYFKDSVLRTGRFGNTIWTYGEEGLLVPMFHGTPNADMFSFDPKRIGSNGTVRGYGFYLTNRLDGAKGYSTKDGKVIVAFVNITNPVPDRKSLSKITKQGIKDFVRKHIDSTAEMGLLSDYGDVAKESYDSILDKYADAVTKYNDSDWQIISQIYHDQKDVPYEEFFKAVKEDFGYDGYVAWNMAEGTIAVAFESNQIKDIANMKPTTSDDIRYSRDLDSDGNELTENQQKFFDKAKTRDEDGSLLLLHRGYDEEKFPLERFYFFSTSEEVAGTYGKTNDYYVNLKNPLIIDARGNGWNSIPFNDGSDRIPSWLQARKDAIRWLKDVDPSDTTSMTKEQIAELLRYALGSEAKKVRIDDKGVSFPVQGERLYIGRHEGEPGANYTEWETFLYRLEEETRENSKQYSKTTDQIAEWAYKRPRCSSLALR